MELIKKESTRMLTFQRRKKCLVKKVSELSTLCGVDACLVVSGPTLDHQNFSRIETVWPSNPDEAKRIIKKFKKSDRGNRCYTLSDYFSDKKRKHEREMLKLNKQTLEDKFPSWDDRLENLSEVDLRLLFEVLESKLQVVDQKIKSFRGSLIDQRDVLTSRMMCDSQDSPSLMGTVHVADPIRFLPGHDAYKFESNSNFMGRNNNPVHSTDLQLFSDSNLMNSGGNSMGWNNVRNNTNNLELQLYPQTAQVPMPLQDMIASHQNFSNYSGTLGKNHTPSVSELLNVDPQFLMPDSVIHHNYVASAPLPITWPQSRLIQHPMPSLANQASSSQPDRFSYDIRFQNQEHN